jgi:GTP-binding nuclear protein Ran
MFYKNNKYVLSRSLESIDMEQTRTFKVCLVGNGGVGKTTFLRSLLTNEFERKYVATLGVEVHPVTFNTNYGKITINMWDTAGQERFGGLRDGYYILGVGALVFHTPDMEHTCERWEEDFSRITGAPMVRVQTKTDTGFGMCSDGSVPISTKNNMNLLGPIVAILNLMLNTENVVVYG